MDIKWGSQENSTRSLCWIVILEMMNLNLFPFFIFYFLSLLIILHFFIFRTLGLGLEVISHTIASDGVVTTLITEHERKK